MNDKRNNQIWNSGIEVDLAGRSVSKSHGLCTHAFHVIGRFTKTLTVAYGVNGRTMDRNQTRKQAKTFYQHLEPAVHAHVGSKASRLLLSSVTLGARQATAKDINCTKATSVVMGLTFPSYILHK